LSPSAEIVVQLLEYPNPAVDNNLRHGRTIKVVNKPCIPLEITLIYLGLLIPAIINKCNIGLPNLV